MRDSTWQILVFLWWAAIGLLLLGAILDRLGLL